MERLNKVLAHAGVASRRKADQLISTGVVTVNGQTVLDLGTKVKAVDRVEVKGVPIYQENLVYYLFYKPRGVISSVNDEKGRRTILDYFPNVSERIYPVGRLDYDTSGLLLVTNDGEFANRILHPTSQIDKTYLATVIGLATKENLRPLVTGVKIDGYLTSPARYEIVAVDPAKNHSIVRLIIHEGRNHQVKKMLASVNLPVKKLKRERVGNLDLTGLRVGEYRRLSKKEVRKLLAGGHHEEH